MQGLTFLKNNKMLIDFRELFLRWNIKPKGVCHIGANIGEEFPVYMELGINNQLWYEPNPELYFKLCENISSNPNAEAQNFCVGNENKDVVLHISNNAGQSSSVLDLGTHRDVHPSVFYVKDITVPMVKLESHLPAHRKGLDFLNIDIQGKELEALKGMGDLLHNFKWAYLEVNRAELYIGCPLIEDLDAYLEKYNFVRVETYWAGNTNWGDALWIKKELLP